MSFINYQDPRPVYEQIVDYYEKLILTGVMKKDEKLPSVRTIAGQLSINPNTIQKAYSILESKGYIYSSQGRGSFVSDNTDLLEGKRRTFIEETKDSLLLGKELGVTREDMNRLIKDIWG